jgi:type I restriction-modification system DNA methylase subunit
VNKQHKEKLSIASQELRVSEATIRNWLKAKLLKTLKPSELDLLKKKLAEGKVNRLNKRANKRLANESVHSHPELLSDKYQHEIKKKLDEFIIEQFDNKYKLLLATYIILLEKANLGDQKIFTELSDWGISFADKKLVILTKELKKRQVVLDASVLAYIYQSASSTGEKNIKGAYYTPISLIRTELKEILKVNNTYCDPCCGGGAFIAEAYKLHLDMKSDQAHKLVYGYDLDKTAVLISRASLTLLSNGQMDVVSQIRCLNAITVSLPNKFDVIATNPPWGAEIKKSDLEILQKKFPFIRSEESFSYFLLQSLNYLKPNAALSFILPESILNIKTHKDIREHLLKNYQIESIKEVSEKFSGVMTKVITLKVLNVRPTVKHHVCLISKSENFSCLQNSFVKDSNFTIALNSTAESNHVLNLIETSSKLSLKNNADWGLGIVTGNNAHFLKTKPNLKTQPVVKGIDVYRFSFNTISAHLLYEPKKFQQIIPIEKFKVPQKLIYRFICKELVFAIDRKQQLTLNSANFVVPRLKTHTIESLCALFNSKLAQYYFHKKHNTFKVLRHHIENFPLSEFSKKQATQIDFLVRMLEKQFNEVNYDKLNHLVYAAYKLDKASIAEIEKTVLSKAFIR